MTYNFAIEGGAVSLITPLKTVPLPKNAVIVGGTLNCTTAGTSGGSATITLGTDAGSSASALLGSTAVASLSANALINLVPTFAAPVKLTAKGNVTMTVGTAALTAGIFEVVLYYYVAKA